MLLKELLVTPTLASKEQFFYFIFTLLLSIAPQVCNANLITFINEIHYDNSGGDVNEFIEIASLTTTDLSDLAVLLYNGDVGKQYKSKALSSYTFNNIINGYGFIKVAIVGIQNGNADGIALVNNNTKQVLQFISYEGSLNAIDGLANGMTSVDIGMKETSSTVIDFSLQLGGIGRYYEDFTWQKAQTNTANTINFNQSFTQVPEPNTQHLLILSFSLLILLGKKIRMPTVFNKS